MSQSPLILSSIEDNLGAALSSVTLWSNVAKTLVFILLGFFLTRKKALPEATGKVLTQFVMAVSLPCLAFCSFLGDFTASEGKDALVNFLLGFVLYLLFIFLGKLLFLWVKDKEKRLVLSTIFAFGSTTFFAYPLVVSLYGDQAGNDFNLMNVSFRIFLYSYCYLVLSGQKVGEKEGGASFSSLAKKVFLNPILIATFAGLLLWLSQAIPGSAIVRKDWLSPHPEVSYQEAAKVAFWRLDVTLPWLFACGKALGELSSPLILFAIGCTLGSTSLKEAAKDKYAWIYAGMKTFLAPVIAIALLFILEAIARACGSHLISENTLHSVTFTWMVPPGLVVTGYCIAYDREKEMASHAALISTLVAVGGIVVWVILLTILDSFGYFPASA